MTADTPIFSRRYALSGAGAVLVCTLVPPTLKGMSQADPEVEVCRHSIISDPEIAKRLLKAKVDQAIFNRPDVMKSIHERFDVKWPTWFIRDLAHNQINHTVEEFATDNAWDTDATRHEPITVESLMRRYKARVSRYFHEKVAPNYADFLKLPADEQREKFEEKFGKLQDILGCALDLQLGRIKIASDGRVGINPDWDDKKKVPFYLRPLLNFDYMIQKFGLPLSPFVITRPDLRAAGIPMDGGPMRPSVAAGTALGIMLGLQAPPSHR